MTKTAIITGSGGLIGSEATKHFIQQGYHVVGIDNDLRAYFFGAEASTAKTTQRLKREYDGAFTGKHEDIRDRFAIHQIFKEHKPELIIHTAAQPSHDWAASAPQVDFGVNAVGTLNLLEATRAHALDATFVHCSTSKVYGDTPNRLPLIEYEHRYDLDTLHPFFPGITPEMSIDQSTHSLFGVSKAAGDLLVQEYGRYFGMPTVCFRPGCLTGPNHAGTQLHGFLAYLMKCIAMREPYTIFGYKGKQVRCNIHSADLVDAFDAFHRAPKAGAVYNIGGGRWSNCSMIEAILACEAITGEGAVIQYTDKARIGDHIWWISDNYAFEQDYPNWKMVWNNTGDILTDIYQKNIERWRGWGKEV